MHRLIAVPPEGVPDALRAALDGGDAVHPLLPDTAVPADLPAEVDDDVALVIGTSGSSGAPKRVALTAAALRASATAADAALGGPGQWLLALPTGYIAGVNVLTRSILAGTEPVTVEGRFDPHSFADAAARMASPRRYTSLVPAQLQALVDADRGAPGDPDLLPALRRFDRILIGGQAAPTALLAAAIELGLEVTTTYGSSETGGGCVYDGVPLPGVRMRLVDGEVQLGGEVLAAGYAGDPARTEQAFVRDGDGARWYRTGDSGELDATGRLRVTGRLDDVIVSGGLKVSLARVEQAVRALPGQADAVVVPIAHPRWGQAPAVVTSTPLELEAAREATAGLGVQARPWQVLVLADGLPMLASGKPDRRALAALLVQRQGTAE